jgi:cytosine/adenosine deaminase-related metal-dependent hydrolase
MLEIAVELSRRHSLYLHTHVAETRSEADIAQNMYGCRMVEHLDDIGFLGPRTSLAHCVWINDEEIDLIARSGAVAVHNPISNMALGSGIAPVGSMVRAKAHVALGTDGSASNGAQDIWESVKCAALLPRCNTPEPADWLTAHQALRLMVDGGREIFGLGPPVIAEDGVADIAIFAVPEATLGEFSIPSGHWCMVLDRERGTFSCRVIRLPSMERSPRSMNRHWRRSCIPFARSLRSLDRR